MPDPTCTIDGCDRPCRSKSAALCKMHYHRLYRHGSTDKVATDSPEANGSNGRRYRTTYRPNHPLALASGVVHIHRVVLYEAIGPGPHACHWCGAEIDWLPKGDPRELQTDHINGIGDDNRLENLVPSCRRCNTTRAAQARSDRLRAAGWWSSHDTIARTGGRTVRVVAS